MIYSWSHEFAIVAVNVVAKERSVQEYLYKYSPI